jgi:hypothetical protein
MQERLEQEKLKQERLEREQLEKEHLESGGDTSGTQDNKDLSQERSEKRRTQIDFGKLNTTGEELVTRDQAQGQMKDDQAIQAGERQVMFKFSPFTSVAHFCRL